MSRTASKKTLLSEKCSVEDCNSPRTGSKSFCIKHLTRLKRHDDINVNNRSKIAVGEKFTRLTVESIVGKDKKGNTLYLCSCECGGTTITRSFSLRSGKTGSCGCLAKERRSVKKARIDILEKQCSSCKIIKNISEFGKKADTVDGHKSQCRKCGRNWHKKNKDRVYVSARHRRRKKDFATPKWVDQNQFIILENQRLEIQEKTKSKYEIDHIIPIKHPLVCGLHVPWNLQIVTAEYNNRKGNRVSSDYLQRNGIDNSQHLDLINSFIIDDPILSNLWDPKLNAPMEPHFVHLSCPIVIWWRCKEGHSWAQSLRHIRKDPSCPVCSGRLADGYSPNFMSTDIAKEWDYNKNHPLRPEHFSRYSNKKAFWICSSNHSYERRIKDRSAGLVCPVCKKLGHRRTIYTKDQTTYNFENFDGKYFSGTILEFAAKEGFNPSMIARVTDGKQKTHKGWFLKGKNPREDLKIFSLSHPIYGEVTGNIPEISNKYKLNRNSLYKIVDPKYADYSHKGWFLKGAKKNKKIIEFFHEEYGIFIGQACELVSKYPGLNRGSLSKVISKKNKSHKGWKLVVVS